MGGQGRLPHWKTDKYSPFSLTTGSATAPDSVCMSARGSMGQARSSSTSRRARPTAASKMMRPFSAVALVGVAVDAGLGPAAPVVVEADGVVRRAVAADELPHAVVVLDGLVHLHALPRQVEVERGLELVGVGDRPSTRGPSRTPPSGTRNTSSRSRATASPARSCGRPGRSAARSSRGR